METKIMDTPLQLNEYFFPHVKVTADQHAADENGSADSDFGVDVHVIKSEEEESSYQVTLVISSTPDSEEKSTPYSIQLVAIGFFDVHPDWKDPRKLLEVNGASILYAAAREFVITITSRGPWGAIMLPTASFLKLYNERKLGKEKEEATGGSEND